jgi:hypothetical protein
LTETGGEERKADLLDLHATLFNALAGGCRVFWLDKLLVVRGSVPKRVIDPTAIPFRSIHKSVEILFDIDRFQDQAFVPSHVGVFDQNSRGTIDAPHLKSRPKESAVRVKLV